MNWQRKLSLRWIILLIPVTGFILVLVFSAVLAYFQNHNLTQLDVIHNDEYTKVAFIQSIANGLSENHVHIYNLMESATETTDEGEFYDKGKPYLLEIHRLEGQLQEFIDSQKDEFKISSQLDSLMKKLVLYRNNTTNAVLMATVDPNLSDRFLRDATRQYVTMNNRFLSLNKNIQEKLSKNTSENHRQTINQLNMFIVLSIIIVVIIVIAGYLLSSALSRNLRKQIFTLKALTTEKPSGNSAITSNNEMDVLSSVTDDVRNNYLQLAETRNELSRKEAYLRTIFDTVKDAIITIDPAGTVGSFNHAAEDIFGYSVNEVIGKNISMLMPDPHHSQHDRYIQNYMETGIAKVINKNIELEGRRKDGSIIPLLFTVSKMSVDGRPIFVGLLRDISQTKRQEELIRRTQKMDALGMLTGGIAHDYNNMLGVILGYTQLLGAALDDDPVYADYIKEIKHAGERSSQLTQKLLSFSKQSQTDAEPTNINLMLENQRLMLEKTLTARIQLQMDLADELWFTMIDAGDLEDAIVNMSINAMHAMESNGILTLSTQNIHLSELEASHVNLKPGDYILLSITDTGCGMDKDTLIRVFDPFFSTKGVKGTGLGLSQVYGFVSRSGGTIRVYSEPGHGTRFALYFPRCNLSKDESADEVDIDRSHSVTGNETIMVVDDEAALRKLTCEILSQQGYNVITAESGEQALGRLATENINLVISDVVMQGMDGYQLASIIQKKHPGVKIQLVSGFNDERHSNMISKSLHQSMLHKPLSSQSLLKRVNELLSAHH